MPYLIITANDEELDRRELSGAVVIGRSPECDIAIHDILLSRIHCRIEPYEITGKNGRRLTRWKVVDLGSKNGTHYKWKTIGEIPLYGGDSLRVGRTNILFETGEFISSSHAVPNSRRTLKIVRPADPHEALSGTVSDFVYAEHDPEEEDFDGAPSSPYRAAEVGHALLPQTPMMEASTAGAIMSPWDSIVATIPQRPRPTPQPYKKGAKTGLPIKKAVEVDLSLQASPAYVPLLEPVSFIATTPRRHIARFILGAVVMCIATAAVVISGWVMAAR